MTFILCQQAAENLGLRTIHRWDLTEWAEDTMAAGCSKRPDISPSQPRCAETRLVPGKAAASEDRRRNFLTRPTPSCRTALSHVGHVEDLNDVRTPHGKRRVSARRGWGGEKSDFFSILLKNQHRIAIAIKAVPLANRLCIRLSKELGPGQRGDQHQ